MISFFLKSLAWKLIAEPLLSDLRLGRPQKKKQLLWKRLAEEDSPSCCTASSTDLTEIDGSEFSDLDNSVVEDENTDLRSQSSLTLEDFVVKSDAQDALALREMMECEDCQWQHMKLVETVPGNTYRRWLFKKTRVHRHLLDIAAEQNITVSVHAKVVLSGDSTARISPTSIVTLLEDIQKDTDVKSIEISAADSLTFQECELLTMALVSLLSCDNRRWDSVVLWANVSHEQPHQCRESELTRNICQRALENIAKERMIPVDISFSSS